MRKPASWRGDGAGEQGGGGGIEGGAGLAEAAGAGGEAFGAQPLPCQRPTDGAQAGAGIGGRAVGGVLDPGEASGGAGGGEGRLGHRQQRSQQAQLGQLADGGHGGETVGAAAVGEAEQQGFRLILAVMAEQEMENAGRRRPLDQQPVARFPRRRLDARRRLGAVPVQNLVGDAEGGEVGADGGGFLIRLGAQPVIDGERQHRPAARPCPVVAEQGEGEAVGAARDGDGEARRGFERLEPSHQGGEIPGRERPNRHGTARPFRGRTASCAPYRPGV